MAGYVHAVVELDVDVCTPQEMRGALRYRTTLMKAAMDPEAYERSRLQVLAMRFKFKFMAVSVGKNMRWTLCARLRRRPLSIGTCWRDPPLQRLPDADNKVMVMIQL